MMLGGGPKQITNTSLIIHVDYASDLTYLCHFVRVQVEGSNALPGLILALWICYRAKVLLN